MRKTLTLLATSVAFIVPIAAVGWGAAPMACDGGLRACVARLVEDGAQLPLSLASDDNDHQRRSEKRGHDGSHDDDDDEDGDDDDGDDDDDDDDDNRRGARQDRDTGRAMGRSPATDAPITPPANGLFGNGAPPRVQVN